MKLKSCRFCEKIRYTCIPNGYSTSSSHCFSQPSPCFIWKILFSGRNFKLLQNKNLIYDIYQTLIR